MDGKWRSHQKHDLYRTGSRERVFANNIVTALVTPTLLAENLHSNVAFARFGQLSSASTDSEEILQLLCCCSH